MKQHITSYQWDELEPAQLGKLRGWVSGRDDYEFTGGMELLSIGQMIEFLDEGWLVSIVKTKNWKVSVNKSYELPELCDALFEAVKEVLDKE